MFTTTFFIGMLQFSTHCTFFLSYLRHWNPLHICQVILLTMILQNGFKQNEGPNGLFDPVIVRHITSRVRQNAAVQWELVENCSIPMKNVVVNIGAVSCFITCTEKTDHMPNMAESRLPCSLWERRAWVWHNACEGMELFHDEFVVSHENVPDHEPLVVPCHQRFWFFEGGRQGARAIAQVGSRTRAPALISSVLRHLLTHCLRSVRPHRLWHLRRRNGLHPHLASAEWRRSS